MDLNYSAQENAFRAEVRAFLKDSLPDTLRRKVLAGIHHHRDEQVAWQQALYRKGWFAPQWPVQYGGTGWNPVQRYIWEEEYDEAGAPRILPFGPNMVGPVIMAFGNDWHKQRFLPKILSSEEIWCQGYSEPGSGSDLASLKTKAERQGDHYIVNGQKTWTTLAHWADWIFCLVRTAGSDVKQQEGISFLLIDMKTPGVEVRPIRLVDGGHEVNEVWFQDVKVPVENLVGQENKGWTCAKYLLSFERSGIAAVGRSKRELRFIKEIAAQERKNGKPLIDDPRFRDKIAQLEIDIMALEVTSLRVLSSESQGKAPGAEVSFLKIKGTEIQQALTELQTEAIGPDALPFFPDFVNGEPDASHVGASYAPPLAPRYCNYRKVSIYGGTNEIQRNIISQHILGL
jgi:alkylation response protein AidB-like acyl-CoA dehydrogenase